jgi:hypothetical protein
MITRDRKAIQVDQRGRTYLSSLGFSRGDIVVAEPVEGEQDTWVIRPGRIVTDAELGILAEDDNVRSLQRAAAEFLRGEISD